MTLGDPGRCSRNRLNRIGSKNSLVSVKIRTGSDRPGLDWTGLDQAWIFSTLILHLHVCQH